MDLTSQSLRLWTMIIAFRETERGGEGEEREGAGGGGDREREREHILYKTKT